MRVTLRVAWLAVQVASTVYFVHDGNALWAAFSGAASALILDNLIDACLGVQ